MKRESILFGMVMCVNLFYYAAESTPQLKRQRRADLTGLMPGKDVDERKKILVDLTEDMGSPQTYKQLLDRIRIIEGQNLQLRGKLEELVISIDKKWEIINVLKKEKNELQEKIDVLKKEKNELQEKIDILQRDIPLPEEEITNPNPRKEFRLERRRKERKKREISRPYPPSQPYQTKEDPGNLPPSTTFPVRTYGSSTPTISIGEGKNPIDPKDSISSNGSTVSIDLRPETSSQNSSASTTTIDLTSKGGWFTRK